MRVLALWVDPRSPNLGVQVLAEGLRGILPSEWEVSFASHACPLTTGSLSLRRLLLATVNPACPMARELRSYDLVIDVGEGDSFASIYGWKRMAQMAMSKVAVARSGTRLVLAPQTLGPWRSRAARRLARLSVARARDIWARDSASGRRGTEVLRRPVQQASDLVFGLPEPAGIQADGLDVVLNVSGLLWHPNPHVDSASYRRLITGTLDRLTAGGRRVGLLAHVIAVGAPDDDVAVVRALAERYPGVESSVAADLDQARAFISRADVVVGSRMHACLNALALGVPTVPLQYSDKFEALFRDLGYSAGLDLRNAGQATGAMLYDRIIRPPSRDETEAARRRGRDLLANFATSVSVHATG